jgi:hypothetical protein
MLKTLYQYFRMCLLRKGNLDAEKYQGKIISGHRDDHEKRAIYKPVTEAPEVRSIDIMYGL